MKPTFLFGFFGDYFSCELLCTKLHLLKMFHQAPFLVVKQSMHLMKALANGLFFKKISFLDSLLFDTFVYLCVWCYFLY